VIRVFDTVGQDGFELCHPVDSDDFETLELLINGEPRKGTWKPLRMKLIREDEGKRLRPSDAPWLSSGAVVLLETAVHVLGPVLEKHGELLPLDCPGCKLVAFNPTHVVDAVDLARSQVVRFKDGQLMDIRKYVFRPDVIRNLPAFKIPNFRISPTFFGQEIVDLWTEAKLKGMDFKLVWEG
jgi:hypothetical protein